MRHQRLLKLVELGSGELLSRSQMKVIWGGVAPATKECNCYLNDPSEENWFTCGSDDTVAQCCGMAGMSMNCAAT